MKEYFNKFLNFCEGIYDIKGDFRRREMNDDGTFYCRFVPEDFDIDNLPCFKKHCKNAGIEIVYDEFISDFTRDNGYRDYHDIILKSNGIFGKILTKEMFE